MYPMDINCSLHVKLTCILSPQHAQRVEASQAMMWNMRVVRWPVLLKLLVLLITERLRFKFTPKGKREFVPRDQVFPLIVVYCLFLPLKNK